jgi:methylmalonyl-CoA/ethylmalonyl-CoA epimerase
MRIDHVAIAVNNLDDAVKEYQTALGIKEVEFETVESEGVRVAILHLENSRIELMEATKDRKSVV